MLYIIHVTIGICITIFVEIALQMTKIRKNERKRNVKGTKKAKYRPKMQKKQKRNKYCHQRNVTTRYHQNWVKMTNIMKRAYKGQERPKKGR